MDVYRQAALIVQQVGRGQGTAKALCLQKQVQKKKQTYAVVCETIRNLERIKKVLKDAEFFEYYPQLLKMDTIEEGSLDHHQHQKQQSKVKFDPKYLIYCMTYDHLYGKGINTRQHPAVKALMEAKDFLFKADSQLPKLVPRSAAEKKADDEAFAAEEANQSNSNNNNANENGNTNSSESSSNPFGIAYSFPRYARINRLMYDGQTNTNTGTAMTNEEILARLQNQNFRRSGVAIRRERNEEIDRKNQQTALLNQKHQENRKQLQNKKKNEDDDDDDEEDQDQNDNNDDDDDEMKIINNNNGNDNSDEDDDGLVDVESNVQKPKMDQHIPGLIVFPPGTDIHAHPLVKQGKLLLQDKASCLPAAILCDLVPNDATKQIPLEGFGYLVDGCSAPGNKTSQLVEYTSLSNYYQNISNEKSVVGGGGGSNTNNNQDDGAAQHRATATRVVAVERDPSRFKLLQQRMQQLTGGMVDCRRGSFESVFESNEIENVGAILLDPSCSSSGVLSRIDQQMKKSAAAAKSNNKNDDDDNNNHAESSAVNDAETEKVKQLAQSQLELVTHALTAFPNCKRVVYSTCSINQEENENVVLAAFAAFLKHHESLGKKKQRRQGKWKVTCIMPDGMWKTRGRFVESEMSDEMKATLPFSKEERDQIASCCIRCDPFADKTSGFFVARFDRIPRED